MEDNKLEINEKLFSFEGVIGRHAFLLNMVIICAISTVVMFPYSTYTYSHIKEFGDFFNISNIFYDAPLLLKLWILTGTAFVSVLSISNVYRRLNDMFGEVRKHTNLVLCSIPVIGAFSFLYPLIYLILFSCLSLILFAYLFFQKGKITGSLPYDYKKEFNWGAFFGTWIWGLFNKSYIPLFELILWLTPLGFYFQMYCGLKGNEWAFKNKGCTDVEEFNKSQRTHATVFSILSLVIIPLVYFIVIFAIIIALVFAVAADSKNAPADSLAPTQNKTSFVESFLDGIVSLYFERYEITENENKFYVLNSDWKSSDFKDKKDMLDLAASKASEVRNKQFKAKHSNGYNYFSKTEELPRTKIYSAETDQLLGEFNMDEEAMNSSFKDAIGAVFKAYRFYNVEE